MSRDQDIESLKTRVCQTVDNLSIQLLEVSHAIHSEPELAFEEHHAHDLLTSVLADAGVAVQRSAFGLDTAFVAAAGTQGSTVGIVCEYDALPGIGHACGHNVIAASGLGAGLALSAIAPELDRTVKIIGTPAEEGGGGKVLMIERGAFDGIDAALMVHPAGVDVATMSTLAIHQCRARYSGVAAHAAAAPHQGVNALDGAVLGYNAIAALRQHLDDSERVHGVFVHGGDKPNIVPSYAETEWYVRSPTVESLDILKSRIARALEGGAVAAGCDVEIEWVNPIYADMVDSQPLVDRYVANADRLGRTVTVATAETSVRGSTDMGNVSHLVPSIHPMLKIAPDDVSIHTPAFADYAAGPSGDQGVIDGAKALAMTAIDIWLDADVLATAGTSRPVRPQPGPRA